MKLKITILAMLLLGQQATADMLANRDLVRSYRQANEQAIVDEFVKLLSIPNVASDQVNIRRNADLLMNMLGERGFTTQLLDTAPGSPAVYGELMTPGATLTLMLYAHYDGQPVQPENWASDPWTPVLRDDSVEAGGQLLPLTAPFDPEARLFARSAGDDKAPVVGLLRALDAMRANDIPVSINIKVFFDGEEEAGSPNLPQVLTTYKDLLAADFWLFCDGPMHQTRRPKLGFGVRGAHGVELTTYGPGRPLHSGHYGNWAPNPVVMMTHLLSSMRDMEGNVLVEGFYDEVVPVSDSERAAIAASPDADTLLREELVLGRSEGDDRLELRIMQPALNFRGIKAGGVGPTARNIIVPTAEASVGIRLVPAQTIEHLERALEAHVRSQGFHVVNHAPTDDELRNHEKVVQMKWDGGGYPSLRTSLDDPVAGRVTSVLQQLHGDQLVVSPTSGGSLPLFHIDKILDVPVLMLPIANHDNNQHGKDENLRLQNLWDGIETYAAILSELGKQ